MKEKYTTDDKAFELWKRAALLEDRTRRAIRARVRAGESIASVAEDFDVPEPFVNALASWQLFEDER